MNKELVDKLFNIILFQTETIVRMLEVAIQSNNLHIIAIASQRNQTVRNMVDEAQAIYKNQS